MADNDNDKPETPPQPETPETPESNPLTEDQKGLKPATNPPPMPEVKPAKDDN